MAKPPAENSHYQQFEKSVETLARLPYRKRREFLWHKDRPRLSRFLYKFRALVPNDNTSVDHMRDILVRSKFWLSSPLDFNDPFDMSAKIIAKGTAKERRTRFKKLLKGQSYTRKAREQALPRLVMKSNVEVQEFIQETFRQAIESIGVYSFGGDPRSILMWSHYAFNHEGACLQFEVAKDIRTFGKALPVEYNDDYPVFNWFKDDKDKYQHAMLRKHVGWSYERESRIVILEEAHQYIRFHPESLRGIIIGCRTGEDTIATLHELIAERSSFGFPPPTLYRAVQHESKYKLVIKKFEPDR